MSSINKNEQVVSALLKPKQQLTIIHSGGLMGAATRRLVVTKGYVRTSGGDRLAYAFPNGRSKYPFDESLQKGCIILKGIHGGPITETDTNNSVHGTGEMRLVAPNGKVALIAFLREHCLIHTLDLMPKIVLVTGYGPRGMEKVTEPLREELLAALPPPVDLSAETGVTPPPVQRKAILKPGDIKKLQAAGHANMKPLIKLFNPCGAHTWLLTSMNEDGDTLWGYVDAGQNCVEHGSISLEELETVKLRIPGLRIEKETGKFRCDFTPQELLAMSNLSHLTK